MTIRSLHWVFMNLTQNLKISAGNQNYNYSRMHWRKGMETTLPKVSGQKPKELAY